MKLKQQIEALNCEAVRHTELAKDIALELLRNPFAGDVEKKKKLAGDHLIRAEAYKTSQKIISGTFKLSVLILALAFTGCATKSPAMAHGCTLLKFPQTPAPSLIAQLAATQPKTSPAEVADWFATGERGFVLASTHTNEIAAAVAAGASATIIHEVSPAMLPTAWGHR